jgi:hypothetical protein
MGAGHRASQMAFQIRKREMGLITLVCLCNDRMDAVKSIDLYPVVEKCRTYKVEFRIKENDPFLRLGTRLKDFDELNPALEHLLYGS